MSLCPTIWTSVRRRSRPEHEHSGQEGRSGAHPPSASRGVIWVHSSAPPSRRFPPSVRRPFFIHDPRDRPERGASSRAAAAQRLRSHGASMVLSRRGRPMTPEAICADWQGSPRGYALKDAATMLGGRYREPRPGSSWKLRLDSSAIAALALARRRGLREGAFGSHTGARLTLRRHVDRRAQPSPRRGADRCRRALPLFGPVLSSLRATILDVEKGSRASLQWLPDRDSLRRRARGPVIGLRAAV